MPAGRRRVVWVLIFLVLFGLGLAGGYLFFSKRSLVPQPGTPPVQSDLRKDDSFFVRIFYPVEGRLVMEERSVPKSPESSLAEATLNEFLKGPSGGAKPAVPQGTRVISVYRGSDGILYADLSDEFRRNFQGDAVAEFLLLKGLYETIISNVQGIDDVKVLIEGKEVESIGGHLFALYPLKETLIEESIQ